MASQQPCSWQDTLDSKTYYAHSGTIDGNHVLDGDIALCLVEAVTTALVEGTECLREESYMIH
jgi:hypothetical protein